MSNTENTKSPAPKPWVRLHLAKQADSCAMPSTIIGVLSQETSTSYLLTNTLEVVPDEEHPAGYVYQERPYYDVVNRTYVYRVEVLGVKPEPAELYGQFFTGGSSFM